MEYIKIPSSLLPNRKENLESDILHIIESADYTSYSIFKEYWRSNNLSMFHHSIRPKEQRQEFYLTFYSILTDLIRTSPDLACKSIFILFTIYFTQPKKPILIPISPLTASYFQQIILISSDCKNLLGKLAKTQAFDYCVSEGVKSYIRPKKTHTDQPHKSTLDRDLSKKITSKAPFDLESLHHQSLTYTYSKEKVKNLIQTNLHLFKSQSLPANPLASRFKAENLQILTLSNPTFPLTLSSKFTNLEKLSAKLNSFT